MSNQENEFLAGLAEEDIDVTDFLVGEVDESEYKLAELMKESANLSEEDFDDEEINGAQMPQSNTPSLPKSNQLTVTQYGNNSNLDNDFEIARKNIIQITLTGASIIEDLVGLAKASEHPNAYNTLTETLKTLSQLNQDLVNLYDKKIAIETKIAKNNSSTGGNSPQIQHNTQINQFVGTTDDLLEQIAKAGLLTLGQTDYSPVEVKPETVETDNDEGDE